MRVPITRVCTESSLPPLLPWSAPRPLPRMPRATGIAVDAHASPRLAIPMTANPVAPADKPGTTSWNSNARVDEARVGSVAQPQRSERREGKSAWPPRVTGEGTK